METTETYQKTSEIHSYEDLYSAVGARCLWQLVLPENNERREQIFELLLVGNKTILVHQMYEGRGKARRACSTTLWQEIDSGGTWSSTADAIAKLAGI